VGRVRPGTRPLAFPSGSALRGRILPPRAARSCAPAGTAVNRPSTPSSRRAVCRRSDHRRSLPAVRSGRRRRVSSRNWSPSSVTLPGGIARVRAQPQLSFRGALWDWVLRWTRQVRSANPCIGSVPLRVAGALDLTSNQSQVHGRHLQPHGQRRQLLLRASGPPDRCVRRDWTVGDILHVVLGADHINVVETGQPRDDHGPLGGGQHEGPDSLRQRVGYLARWARRSESEISTLLPSRRIQPRWAKSASAPY